MAKTIVVTSGKGGVGKTTITANLGRMLATMGERVVLIDIDFGLNNLDLVMDLEHKLVYDILDVINGKCRLKQALIQDTERKNLFVLASGSTNMSAGISGQNIKLLVNSLSSVFDYVLIDCPAGIDLGFHRAIACADEVLLVVTPTLSSIRDADKVLSILASYKLNSIKLVINRVRGDLILDNKAMSPNDVASLLKTEIIGVLPEEDVVLLSNGYNFPVKSQSNKAYKLLAKNVCCGTNKILDLTNKYSGFFGSIKRGIKRSI